MNFFEFEVVCNFRREKLLFHFNFVNSIGYKSNTRLFNYGTSYYFDNFNIYTNYDFYFDYTSTDGCFIYYNLADMNCIKPKEGYALYKGDSTDGKVIVVPKDDCYSYSTETQATIYNPYTMECLTFNSIIKGCKTYTDDLLGCLECLDENASSNDCTICSEGFYKESEDA